MEKTGVALGAADWLHPAWVGGFYPADMPEEWRLTYYNTQFSCVWLPLARWHSVDPASAWQWREDTHAGFQFVLESPPAADARAQAVLEALGDRVGKVCSPQDADLVWFEAGCNLKSLAARIQARPADARLYLISRDGDLAMLESVQTLLGLLGL
jgi:hypothetical protein